MTADDDGAVVVPPIQAFKAALPAHIAQRLASSAQVITALREALDRGWTIPTLAGHCLDAVGRNAERPAGVVHYQLIQAAKTDPPRPEQPGRIIPIAQRKAPECVRCGAPTWVRTLTGTPICATCLIAGPAARGDVSIHPPQEALDLIAELRARLHRPKDAPDAPDETDAVDHDDR